MGLDPDDDGLSWIDYAYDLMRHEYHMSDHEFWFELSLPRLCTLIDVCVYRRDPGGSPAVQAQQMAMQEQLAIQAGL